MHAHFKRPESGREKEEERERVSEQNGRRVHPIFFAKGLRMYVYPVLKGRGMSAAERIWHIQNSQGQITALAFRSKSAKPWKLLPLRSEAVYRVQRGRGM